jgi:hypothetical protein
VPLTAPRHISLATTRVQEKSLNQLRLRQSIFLIRFLRLIVNHVILIFPDQLFSIYTFAPADKRLVTNRPTWRRKSWHYWIVSPSSNF